jgi:DNA-binding CsgD family transcriptional regulator
MTDQIDPIHLIDDAPALRLWLLVQAMRSRRFDHAIEWARIAESFIIGAPAEDLATDRAAQAREQHQQDEDLLDRANEPTAHPEAPTNSLNLSAHDRDRLLQRFAEGARNAELAAEFDISGKQVQGLRMGCAREIARRRVALVERSPQADDRIEQTTAPVSLEEVVRYLRQQDDVVVPQEDGFYLVNARFRLSAAELTLRANRMRDRQSSPAFALPRAAALEVSAATNRHPVFWEDSALTNPARNGLHQPSDPEDA